MISFNRITFIKSSLLSVALSSLLVVMPTFAQETNNLDELLSRLKNGQIAQTKQNQAREKEFNQKVNQQERLLKQAQSTRDQAIATSTSLETQFQDNEIKLANKTEALTRRMGELKELFGVLQQVAGDTKSKFQTSVVSAQIAGRGEFLDELAQSMGSSSKLASIEEIERLWFELQREMTQSGKVHTFTRDVLRT